MGEEFNQADAIGMLDNALSGEQTQAAPTTDEEALDYFVGDKPGKLPLSALLAFKEANKIDKIPFSKVINGYRMNAKTSQQNAELLKNKTLWEQSQTKQKEFEESYKPYKALQDWSVELETKNPVGFKYLMDAIDKVKAGTFGSEQAGGDSALTGTIAELRQELQNLKEWKGQFDEQQQDKQAQADRAYVDNEIVEFKKKFPEINLDEADENQIPLSTRVESFGVDNGYRTFTDAARAYFNDKIEEILLQRGKTQAIGGLKKDNANGILARSSTPFTKGHPSDGKNKMLEEFEAIINR